ncbi:ORF6N domain-containing protein [Lachnospiraceae bacterium 46-15]
MKNEMIKIRNQEVTVKEYKGQRVVTFKDVDSVHERPDGTTRKRFNDNKKYFVEGEDFFVRKTDEAKNEFGIVAPNGLVLLTESGYLMLVKSFTDELAWKVQKQLVKSYFAVQNIKKSKPQSERLASVNNAVKILTPMLKAAGCDSKIQLLTAKTLYEKAGVQLPVLIESGQQYYDTVHIARQIGLCYQSSGKPADKAVNEIIRRLDIPDSMYTETWESKGKWQGTVRKYVSQVIDMIRQWIVDNDYPRDIEYVQCDGQKKRYHVIWRKAEV